MGKSKMSVVKAGVLRGLSGLCALAAVAALPGCATYSANFAQVESSAANRDLDKAVKTLDALNLTGPDETLHHLNKGVLLRLQGSYAESNKHLEAAKRLMERLNAISVTEQVASVTVNDTMKAYEGLPSEQLMVYSFKALNYLQMGDVDAAAVEARQFDVKQKLIAARNKDADYLSGAFVRYLNAMVFEVVGERDAARIELEKAAAGYKAQGSEFSVPSGVRDDLSRIRAGKPVASEVVFILHNGLGASVDEDNIRVANPMAGKSGPLMFSLAVPKFVRRSLPVHHVVLSSASVSSDSEVVENVNGIAEKSFNDRLASIIARGVLRLGVKNAAAQEAKRQMQDNPYSALLNFAADVATNVSERADTRTWSLLPGNIQMARLPLPAGRHDVTATYYGAHGNILASREFKGVEVAPARKTFVADYFLNPPAAAKAAN